MAQKQDNNTSFMHGAIILLIANALVKVIGAVFKIPLTYVLGEEGMGYFSTSYQMYTWMFIIATAGIPVAISKMVSESRAKGRIYEVKRIFSVSFKLLSVIGIFGFLMLYFGADFFASVLLKNSRAAHGIRAIAPAMLFVSFMSAYRGYFQGHQNMLPTAVSEVAEAIGKLLVGFFAAFAIKEWLGYGIEYSSAGAVFGVSFGAALGCFALVIIYVKSKKNLHPGKDETGVCESDGTLLKKLIKIAVPITIGASVFSLTSLIDMAMIMRRLQAGGFSEMEANKLWGSYSGFAFPLFNLPPTLINAITVSIVPAIASAYASGNFHGASHTTCKSMKITVLFSLPCALGMSILAEPILNLVYGKTHAAQTLEILSLGIVFVSLVLVTNAILQATGNTVVPVKNMLIGGALKVLINYFLVAHPSVNIKGAPIGTTVCYIVILALNIIDMKRHMKIKFPVGELVLKPLLSVLVMGAVIFVLKPFTSQAGRVLSCIIPIIAGGVFYLIALVLLKGINQEDIELLPKADKLVKICKKIKIIR